MASLSFGHSTIMVIISLEFSNGQPQWRILSSRLSLESTLEWKTFSYTSDESAFNATADVTSMPLWRLFQYEFFYNKMFS